MSIWEFPNLAFILSPLTLLVAVVSIGLLLLLAGRGVGAPGAARPRFLVGAGIGALAAVLMGFGSVCGNWASAKLAQGPLVVDFSALLPVLMLCTGYPLMIGLSALAAGLAARLSQAVLPRINSRNIAAVVGVVCGLLAPLVSFPFYILMFGHF